jgi:GTP cyclohydrolase II
MNTRSAMPTTCRVASTRLPTRYGDFAMHIYNSATQQEHVALTVGTIDAGTPIYVRLHSECFTGDIFSSQRCDCGEQLDLSLRFLQHHGCGILLYLRQEGRGIGLTNKIRAYALQDQGLDTVDANLALGMPEDMRDYGDAAEMLLDLGVRQVILLTNNPHKIEGLRQHGIDVIQRLPLMVQPNTDNLHYFQTKRDRMGHLLPLLSFEAS